MTHARDDASAVITPNRRTTVGIAVKHHKTEINAGRGVNQTRNRVPRNGNALPLNRLLEIAKVGEIVFGKNRGGIVLTKARDTVGRCRCRVPLCLTGAGAYAIKRLIGISVLGKTSAAEIRIGRGGSIRRVCYIKISGTIKDRGSHTAITKKAVHQTLPRIT